jgi:hypothetical protein
VSALAATYVLSRKGTARALAVVTVVGGVLAVIVGVIAGATGSRPWPVWDLGRHFRAGLPPDRGAQLGRGPDAAGKGRARWWQGNRGLLVPVSPYVRHLDEPVHARGRVLHSPSLARCSPLCSTGRIRFPRFGW